MNLQDKINTYFINSNDFNGIHYLDLLTFYNNNQEKLIEELIEGILEERILVYYDVNSHIIRITENSTIEKQLELIKSDNLHNSCIYPTEKQMLKIRNLEEFSNRPFTKLLALAKAQLKPVFFEMNVLERYALDPRYIFKIDNYEGEIYIQDEYYESDSISEQDKVFIQSFSIGHTVISNRRVLCVFLRDLSDLSPDHQQFWKTKEISEECNPFYYYYVNSVLGQWEFCLTIFAAFIEAQKEINELCVHIFYKKLFRVTYEDEIPSGFSYILSPTQKNYEDFILLLDKMLSDNIDKNFFKDIIELEYEKEIHQNKVQIISKGTLFLLEEWLKSLLKPMDQFKVETLIMKPLKTVRKIRQNPAHKITTNVYNPELIDEQTNILSDVLRSLENIQNILRKNPRSRNFEGVSVFEREEIYML